jgi:hypothetical protein
MCFEPRRRNVKPAIYLPSKTRRKKLTRNNIIEWEKFAERDRLCKEKGNRSEFTYSRLTPPCDSEQFFIRFLDSHESEKFKEQEFDGGKHELQ